MLNKPTGITARDARTSARLVALVGASLLSLALVDEADVWAQDGATQRAKQFFEDGQNRYLQGKYLQAAKKFIQAHEAKPIPIFLFNIAVSFEKAAQYKKALRYYESYYLEADPRSPDRKLSGKRIAAIRDYLKALPPEGATTPDAPKPAPPKLSPVKTRGLVVVESRPKGADIYLDDQKEVFRQTPFADTLPPGERKIFVKLKEFVPMQKTILVRHDRMSILYFDLTRRRNLGWIEVKGNVAASSVYLDQRSFGVIGKSPYSGYLRPGKRKVIVERPGYEPFETEVAVVAGKTYVVEFKLEPVNHGWFRVSGRTARGAKVVVDGKPVTCPKDKDSCGGKVAPGKHKLRVERSGFKTYEADFELERTEEVNFAVQLNPKPSRLPAYISFGLSAALLGGGIAAGLVSNSQRSSIEDDLDNKLVLETQDSRVTTGKVLAIVANSLFGLSAIAWGVGFYFAFRDVGPASTGETVKRKIGLAPLLGPSFAGFSGRVRF